MRTVLITGSSRGIGRECALVFAKAGYNVIINYKENDAAADEVFTAAAKLSRCIKVKADVRQETEVDRLYKESKKAFGFVDTVVNNAGVNIGKLLIDSDILDYQTVMDTNLKGAFLVSKAFLPDMYSNRFGRVINVSSILGECGAAGEVIYSASKAGLIGLTKALSKESAPMGVTVNAVTPGLIDTDMIKEIPDSVKKGLVENMMVGRIGQPSDVARACEFLARRESEYISGQALGINGEWVLV